MKMDSAVKDFVLINADDNMINRFLISKILEEQGLKALEACDGEEVMEKLDGLIDRPVIILLDLNMPVMNGYDVINQIKEDSEKYHLVKIIVISGVSYSEFLKSGLNNDISSYIEKPYTPDLVLNRINDCLQNF